MGLRIGAGVGPVYGSVGVRSRDVQGLGGLIVLSLVLALVALLLMWGSAAAVAIWVVFEIGVWLHVAVRPPAKTIAGQPQPAGKPRAVPSSAFALLAGAATVTSAVLFMLGMAWWPALPVAIASLVVLVINLIVQIVQKRTVSSGRRVMEVWAMLLAAAVIVIVPIAAWINTQSSTTSSISNHQTFYDNSVASNGGVG